MRPLLRVAPVRAGGWRLFNRPSADPNAVGPNLLGGQRSDDRPRRHNQLPMAIQGVPQILGTYHLACPAQDLSVGGGLSDVAIGSHQSHTPRTIQRTGEFFAPTSSRAPAPSFDKMTRSFGPAPRLSIAKSGSPSASPSTARGCTSSRRQPSSVGCFTVATP